MIQAAWADLQQLPTAWDAPKESPSRTPAQSGVVEFGSLGDEPITRNSPRVVAATVANDGAAGDDATELDDEESIVAAVAVAVASQAPIATVQRQPSPPVRRPRVFHDRVPDAVDPFDDRFEEEELVLDSFATLAGIFRPRTPRVENRRDPAFARDGATRARCVGDGRCRRGSGGTGRKVR